MEFSGVKAVADATFEVKEGTVHGVIGKNGAGKPVLMNMIAGVLAPTGGALTLAGSPLDIKRWSPREATDCGIALIPQEPPELPFLTVQNFLFMGDHKTMKAGFVQHKVMRQKIADMDERLALRVKPSYQMAALPIEGQQLLAFGKAVFLNDARVVLLDEITASLSGERCEALLNQLRELRHGRSFTMISHRISEIMSACDAVTVMRDGVSVETVWAESTGPQQLAAAIVTVGNADTHVHVLPEPRLRGKPVLRLTGVSSPRSFDKIDLVVHQHEVLSLAGVEGSGKDELLESRSGLRPPEKACRVAGINVPVVCIGAFVAAGACAGLGGLLAAGRLFSVDASMREGDILIVFAAVTLGGTALAGGKGRVTGLLGAQIVFGVVLLLAILLSSLQERLGRARA